MRTVRTLEVEWMQVLWGSTSSGAKEDESSAGCVWAAGYHHVTARSRLAGILKLRNHLFLNFPIFFSGRSELLITETADPELLDMEAHLYLVSLRPILGTVHVGLLSISNLNDVHQGQTCIQTETSCVYANRVYRH
jgi:hypothetical protein